MHAQRGERLMLALIWWLDLNTLTMRNTVWDGKEEGSSCCQRPLHSYGGVIVMVEWEFIAETRSEEITSK